VECDLDLHAGDQVLVAIDDAHLLSTSLLLYMLPLLVMLAAVAIGSYALPSVYTDTWLPAIALASLLLVFRLIHHFQAVFLLHVCFKPQIVKKIVTIQHENILS